MSNFFGTIENPIEDSYGGLFDANGPLSLLSNIFQAVALAGAFIAVLNMFNAGYKYIYSNGDPGLIEKANTQMIYSLIGILIIISTYMIAALIGWVFFGRADYLFRPEIFGPGA